MHHTTSGHMLAGVVEGRPLWEGCPEHHSDKHIVVKLQHVKLNTPTQWCSTVSKMLMDRSNQWSFWNHANIKITPCFLCYWINGCVPTCSNWCLSVICTMVTQAVCNQRMWHASLVTVMWSAMSGFVEPLHFLQTEICINKSAFIRLHWRPTLWRKSERSRSQHSVTNSSQAVKLAMAFFSLTAYSFAEAKCESMHISWKQISHGCMVWPTLNMCVFACPCAQYCFFLIKLGPYFKARLL